MKRRSQKSRTKSSNAMTGEIGAEKKKKRKTEREERKYYRVI